MGDTAAGEVLIVGTGLIGTSIGLRLSQAETRVLLSDSDPSALAAAERLGAGVPLPSGASPGTVVVAVPPGEVVDVVLRSLRDYPDAIVCDVASCKSRIVEAVGQSGGPDATRFVGTHPMAGSEVSGPQGARGDLFEDRRWAITPTESTDPRAVAVARDLATACGAVVVELDPREHDRAVALTSHLPQIIASAMAARLVDAPATDVLVSGQGLRDTTRIADSDPALWADILAGNSAQVVPLLNGLIADLEAVAEDLRDGTGEHADARHVAELLRRGNAGRQRLPAKHGGRARPYSSVTVVVADRPGELARLFTTAGSAGVNLEDVRIEHSVGILNALVELSVLPKSLRALREALERDGWPVRAD